MLKKFLRSSIYLIVLTVASTVGAILIKETLAAYVGPTANPPSSNVSGLIDTSATAQTKTGDLTANKLTASAGGLCLGTDCKTVWSQVGGNSGWTDGGTNVYLSTLTDLVGIGTATPNKQLHIKTASGNAEMDIQSASQNYWALYHDVTTEQLRFWNADFTGDVGSGIGNAFVIDNDGTILVRTPLASDSANSVATKGYVDAAAGTGDATAANQTSIMGTGFNTANDSLINISGRVGKPSDSPSLTSSLFSSLGYIWNNKNDFGQWAGAQAGTYFKVGGVPYFCQKHVVDSTGKVIITSINESNVCEPGKLCSGGQCISGGSGVLTWSGSTKTSFDCANDGGSVYNTSSGTICEFSGSSCPSSWTQAGSWQRYSSSSFGGDSCGNWTGSAPTSFSNQQATYYFKGSSCSWWSPNCDSSVWSTAVNFWDGSIQYTQCNAISSSNPSTNRVEIGCY